MEKPNPFQHTVPKVFHINLFNSRSGRRGRMPRHMRDNMASRGRDTGKLRPEGGRCPCFDIRCNGAQNKGRRGSASPPYNGGHFNFDNMQRCVSIWDKGKSGLCPPASPPYNAMCFLCCDFVAAGVVTNLLPRIFSLPLSSPGVFTKPPAKPTVMFYRPNRQWCGAQRGGGEGSPRARVSICQHERACCNASAIFTPVADRQQQKRSSGHRRAASIMARTRASRTMDLLDMKKRYDFHPGEAQQNMGTGNAALSRCLYPFLRPLDFFNSPTKPLCKAVRAGGVREMIRFMNSKEMPFRCRAGTPAGTARFFTFSAVYHNENLVTF